MTSFHDKSFGQRVDILADAFDGSDPGVFQRVFSRALAYPMAAVSFLDSTRRSHSSFPRMRQTHRHNPSGQLTLVRPRPIYNTLIGDGAHQGEAPLAVPDIRESITVPPQYGTSETSEYAQLYPRESQHNRRFNSYWDIADTKVNTNPYAQYLMSQNKRNGKKGKKVEKKIAKKAKKIVKKATKNMAKRINRFSSRRGRGRKNMSIGRRAGLRTVAVPNAYGYVGRGGNTMEYVSTPAAGCIRVRGKLRIAYIGSSSVSDQYYFNLTHNGTTNNLQQLVIAPYNSLYFPNQIVVLTRMFQQWAINTKMTTVPTASSSNNAGFRLAHTYDCTVIQGYASPQLTLSSNVPDAAFDAQAHQRDASGWRPNWLPWMNHKPEDEMRKTSFPNIAAPPDVGYDYTASDSDEKVTLTWHPQNADIRGSTYGAYWIKVSGGGSQTLGDTSVGTVFLDYDLFLCDMTTTTAGYSPQLELKISSVDLKDEDGKVVGKQSNFDEKRNVLTVPEGHPGHEILRNKNSTVHVPAPQHVTCKKCGHVKPQGSDCKMCVLLKKFETLSLDKVEKKSRSKKSEKSDEEDE